MWLRWVADAISTKLEFLPSFDTCLFHARQRPDSELHSLTPGNAVEPCDPYDSSRIHYTPRSPGQLEAIEIHRPPPPYGVEEENSQQPDVAPAAYLWQRILFCLPFSVSAGQSHNIKRLMPLFSRQVSTIQQSQSHPACCLVGITDAPQILKVQYTKFGEPQQGIPRMPRSVLPAHETDLHVPWQV